MTKRILIFTLLLFAVRMWAGTCGNGYSYSRKINLIKVPNGGADVSNWVYSIPNLGGDPVNKELLNGALKDAAHGGQIQNSAANGASETGPADMILCDAASAGNAIPFEVASWDNVNGTLELYFLLTTWHVATNDAVYLFLNNSSVSTTQQDSGLGTNTNFWSTAGYVEVCHFESAKCSLSQGTEVNHSATFAAGKFGNAASFNGSAWIDLGSPINLSTVTVSMWWNQTSTAACARTISNLTGSAYSGYELYVGSSCTADTIAIFQVGNAGTLANADYSNAPTVNTGEWHGYEVNQTGTSGASYLDGRTFTPHGSGTPTTIGTSSVNMNVGRWSGGGSNNFTGLVDELRISNSVRSANFIANDYWLQMPNLPAVPNYPAGSNHMTYQVVPATTPTVATGLQFASCYATSATFTCPMPFNKQAGSTILPLAAGINDEATSVSDMLGFTYTLKVHSLFTGTLQAYNTDIYTTPQSATTGADTLTFTCSGCAGHDITALVWEVASATPTGSVATNSNLSPPGAMSVTNPSNGSFKACNIQLSNFGPLVTTEGYSQVTTPPVDYPNQPPTHGSNNTSPYANNVASGAQTCTANTVGSGGTLIVMPYAAPTSPIVKHRVTQ